MLNPVLVEATRGGLVESRHRGAIAVVDPLGHTLFSRGDAGAAVFPRSAVKIMQALGRSDLVVGPGAAPVPQAQRSVPVLAPDAPAVSAEPVAVEPLPGRTSQAGPVSLTRPAPLPAA